LLIKLAAAAETTASTLPEEPAAIEAEPCATAPAGMRKAGSINAIARIQFVVVISLKTEPTVVVLQRTRI